MQPTTPALTRCGSPSPPPARPSAAASATPDAFPPPLLDQLAADLAAQVTWHRNLVPPRAPLRTQDQTARGPVQDPQARRDHPADTPDQDHLLAHASSGLT